MRFRKDTSTHHESGGGDEEGGLPLPHAGDDESELRPLICRRKGSKWQAVGGRRSKIQRTITLTCMDRSSAKVLLVYYGQKRTTAVCLALIASVELTSAFLASVRTYGPPAPGARVETKVAASVPRKPLPPLMPIQL